MSDDLRAAPRDTLTNAARTGPLAGIRVIDMTTVVSGPAAASVLADQGADVIKVESLRGDQTRHGQGAVEGLTPLFVSCNRGKRSIALDLKRAEGGQALRDLVRGADVFMQNFRPGVADRLGFGEAAVRALNPSIVYLSISGVGETGPYAGKRVYDPIIQAISGLADIQADPVTGRPRMVRTIIADKTTAIYAAQAVTAALVHRERTGEGQHVQVSMLDAMVSSLWPEGMAPLTFVGERDEAPRMSVHDLIFEVADGFITVGTQSDAEWRGLCTALEKPEWIDDPRFNSQAARGRNRTERLGLVGDILRTGTRDHWLAALDRADVPCAPVLRRHEVLIHDQVSNNDLVQTLDHPGAGAVRQARPAARFDRTPAVVQGPAPLHGEHTRDLLGELGYDDDAIDAWLRAGIAAAPGDTSA